MYFLSKGKLLHSTLLLIVFFMPLWPSYYVIKVEGLPSFDLTRILMFVLLLLWSLSFISSSQLRFRLKYEIQSNRKVIVLLLMFFVWKLVSVISAVNYGHAIFAALKDTIYYFFLFLIAITVWKEKEQLITVVKTMVIASILIAIITIIEFMFQYNFLASLAPQAFESLQIFDGTIRDGSYRTYGTFANSLALASYVVMMLPLSAWLLLESRGRWKLISFISLIGLFACVYTSGSRAALVTVILLLGGSTFFKLLAWKRKFKGKAQSLIVIILIFVGILGSVAVTSIGLMMINGRTEKESGSSNVRMLQIELGVPLILSRPMLGYGPGETADILGLNFATVDNYFLTLALESGIFVSVLFVAIFFIFSITCWNLQKVLPPPWSSLSMSLFLVIICDTLFLSIISLEQTIPLMFLMFAMVTVLKSNYSHQLRKNSDLVQNITIASC